MVEKDKQLAIHNSSSVQVVCHKNSQLCESNYFMIYPEIDYPNFKLKILLKISESEISFKNFFFSAKTVNPNYTIFMTALKYLLVCVSLVNFAFYASFYFKLNPFIRTFEHKAIFYLSIYLIFFNDPLSIFSLLWPSVIFSLLSSFFYSFLLTGLIVFWSIMLRRIHREATTPETKLINNKYTIFTGASITTSLVFIFNYFFESDHCVCGYQKKPFFALQ